MGTISATNFSSNARRTATAVRTTFGSIRWRRIRAACFRQAHVGSPRGRRKLSPQNLDIIRVDGRAFRPARPRCDPGSKNGHVVVRHAVRVKAKKGAN